MKNTTGLNPEFIRKVHLINYLLKKFDNGTEIIKLVKLMFFADVYSLVNYGDSLTRDEYFALERGPVASMVSNIVNQNNDYVTEDQMKYIKEHISRDNEKKNTFDSVFSDSETDESYLSETDKETIDYIHGKLGDKTPDDLIELSHEFDVWKEHEDDLGQMSINRKKMNMNISSVIDDAGKIDISEKDINLSKKYLIT